MKIFKYSFAVLIFLFLTVSIHSQPLTVGAYSGVSVSDIHGNDITGKWKFKPGASAGIYADYSFLGVFGVRTGIGFSSVYYEKISYWQNRYQPWEYYPAWSSYYDPSLYRLYLPPPEKMDFSFITFPLELRVSIPARPRIDIGGGIYYSAVKNPSLNYYYTNIEGLKENDLGYLWSLAFSLPLAEDITVSLGTSYYSGRTRFMEYNSYRHGHADILLGLSYNGFLKNKKVTDHSGNVIDSLPPKLSVTYYGGVNLNMNSCEYFPEKYSASSGFSAGFMLNLRWAPKSSFRTGISFVRTGYGLSDSSSVFYRYVPEGNPMYMVDTETGIDYITIPALLNLYLGKQNRIYINTGPWLAFRLNARVTGKAYREDHYGNEFSVTEVTVYDDITSVVKGSDVGWIAGTGVEIPFGKGSGVQLGLSYSRGLNDLLDRSYFGSSAPVDTYLSVMKNSTITFHAGIIIPAR